ncbi:hypothetical protein BJ878DRAFT_31121 [Calycina marina]|uniref:Uncharacterized protein n=1 Tax=Calycina marina TaxID=1763456 RepID=A0A9P7Z4I4_9HELO|nr:hypothetical protein BJ878DRAFT_31121 [Calycina marina]
MASSDSRRMNIIIFTIQEDAAGKELLERNCTPSNRQFVKIVMLIGYEFEQNRGATFTKVVNGPATIMVLGQKRLSSDEDYSPSPKRQHLLEPARGTSRTTNLPSWARARRVRGNRVLSDNEPCQRSFGQYKEAAPRKRAPAPAKPSKKLVSTSSPIKSTAAPTTATVKKSSPHQAKLGATKQDNSPAPGSTGYQGAVAIPPPSPPPHRVAKLKS